MSSDNRTLYFDLVCGASGDMILGALLDLGVPLEFLRERLGRLGIPGLRIDTAAERRGGLSCTRVVLEWTPASDYRHTADIMGMIAKGGFGDAVEKRCALILDRLADAESRVHGVPRERVHFHEIGAVDTIIDVAGAVLGIEYLEVGKIAFSKLTEGHGTIVTAHGRMPVPAPATALMCEGLAITTLDIPTEILTPTGCAVLTALGHQEVVRPGGILVKMGHGCGTKVFQDHPNLLRAFLLAAAPSEGGDAVDGDTVCVLESDMDHISGELLGHTAGLLLERGALDVTWVPVFMKKGRPGYRLCVVADPGDRTALTDLIFTHTRTLGVRVEYVERVKALRRTGVTELLGAQVQEKLCSYKGYRFRKIEYEALASLSRERGIPIADLVEQYIRDRQGGA